MKNEIKEILNNLKNKDNDIKGINFLKYQDLTRGEINLLLNYITNLQQEKDTYKEQLRITHKDLEHYISRCEKAVEYIMTELIDEWSIRNQGYVSGSDLPVDAITPLLNILQNGSDSQ